MRFGQGGYGAFQPERPRQARLLPSAPAPASATPSATTASSATTSVPDARNNVPKIIIAKAPTPATTSAATATSATTTTTTATSSGLCSRGTRGHRETGDPDGTEAIDSKHGRRCQESRQVLAAHSTRFVRCHFVTSSIPQCLQQRNFAGAPQRRTCVGHRRAAALYPRPAMRRA